MTPNKEQIIALAMDALERIADPRNTHFAGDAQVVAREVLAQIKHPVAYGCHIDLGPNEQPDGCVLDGGNRNDCFYAMRFGDKAREKCGEWKPIMFV